MKRLLQLVRMAIARYRGMNRSRQVENIYRDHEYLDAYSRHTDLRVDADPESAVGGLWEELGRLQVEFLVSRGLKPNHKMLDLGCGTLRAGRHFIKYLDSGNYYGMDLSPKAVAYAKELVHQEGLSEKRPHLMVSDRKDLQLLEFQAHTFDFLLAHSVFTHLKPEHIQECFENVGRIMHGQSALYFTFVKGEMHRQSGLKDFSYPFSFFEALADRNAFTLGDCSADYDHPRGQTMVELRKRR
jgi:SAM-dependent methyltransferase